ncbi:NADH-flavin reductase [Reticulibacter mediterranei]|uniref:NADH-flavin reductase n=1 Tax=Reticulibacter mediterranei TaxID=2778369 RepID=A0A8J3IXF5_9CHLR|nr:SDR family oxidoreductase [Reticulibacter mediterranei]GHP00266.1 NADH-flavin reductase [Reticulibacter mediterranei]
MRIVLFGAAGPTGRLVLDEALKRGFMVTAAVRNPDSLQIEDPHLRIVKCDVYDAGRVEQAIANQDAVISTYGVPYSFKPITAFSTGMANIIQGMKKNGVKRLICVTSGGTKPGNDENGGFVFNVIIKGIIGRTLYADMRFMEQEVMDSELDWTIVRPSRLIDAPALSSYRVTEGYPREPITRRIDLAHVLIEGVSDNQLIGKGIGVVSDKVANDLQKEPESVRK